MMSVIQDMGNEGAVSIYTDSKTWMETSQRIMCKPPRRGSFPWGFGLNLAEKVIMPLFSG